MKKTTFIGALLMGALTYAQVAGTSFEEPNTFSGTYTDTGDPNTAHDLLNNSGQPLVDFTSIGGEMGFNASYLPYNTPDVGLTDGDDVGVTDKKPSSSVTFTDGAKGYRMSDLDGNFILEFDPIDLSGISTPGVSVDFLIGINSNASNGNYEGDGTVNEAGSDRLRIYIRDITNSNELDLFNSTGTDLDDLVPFDAGTGEYQLEWQNATISIPSSLVQLVIEGRNNAATENYWFDNVMYLSAISVNEQFKPQFSVFPNPASSGYVNILSKIGGPKTISIFDVLGKQLVKTTLIGDRLDISKLKSGVYIIKIEQGKNSTTKKLVIK